MADYTLLDLEKWDEKIVEIAKSYGLDWYPIAYETVNYHEMIGAMARVFRHYGNQYRWFLQIPNRIHHKTRPCQPW